MRKPALIAAMALAGCATGMPDTTPLAPRTAWQAMYQAMRYDYKTEHATGRDVWTSGCPAVGDCEDVALCMVENLRRQGKQPELLEYRWKNGTAPWTHIMVRQDSILMDYYGLFKQPNERVELLRTCHQLATTPDKPAWSAAGAWQCLPATPGSAPVLRLVK